MMNDVVIGGSDTAAPLNLKKRLGIIGRTLDVTGLRVLDMGCGAGAFVDALCRMGANAQGIEYQRDKIAEWHSCFPGDDRVAWGDAEHLEFEDEIFDVVFMNEVLEHIPNDVAALNEAFRVLKKGGTFFNFTPNRFYPIETHGFLLKDNGLHVSGLRFPLLPWLPLPLSRKLVSFWCRNYWPWELAKLTKDAGFNIVKHKYIWQTFENISNGKKRIIHSFSNEARILSCFFERIPFFQNFGVSQLIISRK